MNIRQPECTEAEPYADELFADCLELLCPDAAARETASKDLREMIKKLGFWLRMVRRNPPNSLRESERRVRRLQGNLRIARATVAQLRKPDVRSFIVSYSNIYTDQSVDFLLTRLPVEDSADDRYEVSERGRLLDAQSLEMADRYLERWLFHCASALEYFAGAPELEDCRSKRGRPRDRANSLIVGHCFAIFEKHRPQAISSTEGGPFREFVTLVASLADNREVDLERAVKSYLKDRRDHLKRKTGEVRGSAIR